MFDDSRVSIPTESGSGLSEICISARSYLLFYQRRPYVRRQLTWFPQSVPDHIVQKYQRKMDGEDLGQSYVNGNSIFYQNA